VLAFVVLSSIAYCSSSVQNDEYNRRQQVGTQQCPARHSLQSPHNSHRYSCRQTVVSRRQCYPMTLDKLDSAETLCSLLTAILMDRHDINCCSLVCHSLRSHACC